MNWKSLCKQAGFDSAMADRIKKRLSRCKDDMASVCLLEGSAGRPSPLKFIAKAIGHMPLEEETTLQNRVTHYLNTVNESTSGKTYEGLWNQLKEEAREEIIGWLNPDQARIVSEIGISMLLESEGKSLEDRLRELLDTAFFAETRPRIKNHGDKYRGLFCPKPFEYAQVEPSGEMFLCCPQHLITPAGDLTRNNFMEVWNSEQAQAIRGSIIDGSFKYCSDDLCGLLQNRNLPKLEDPDSDYHQIINDGMTRLDRGPKTIDLSYDRSCNLTCPSCRSGAIVLDENDRQRVEAIHDHVFGSHIRNVHRLIITGSGDPFVSKLYFSFLKTFDPQSAPDLRIHLSTNGLLFTEKRWEMICKKAIDMVDISVDAASPETYRLNRGGDYDKLLLNLRFIGELRRTGELQFFTLHFVVQANNFIEMKDFVMLAREVHCDFVSFKQLVNWGTYSENDYLERAVQIPTHPLHNDFIKVISDPVFRLKMVYMHDLFHLLEDND